jgi:acetyltransferase-like isoleucine patch superfamily enzyme
MIKTPILFLIYKRPSTTQKVFDAIRAARPKKLFVAANGPNPEKESDYEKCEETRNIIKQVDWDCELITLFRSNHLNVGLSVSSSITWFFEQVEEGIILEDDCLPNTTFFRFCEELLEKYKHDDKIMQISGNTFISKNNCNGSYYFSKFPFVWGWASWRRAWSKYDYMYHDLSNIKRNEIISQNFENPLIAKYWQNTTENHVGTNINMTWDYQWFFSIWKNDGVVILPKVNLVSNIGFGNDATHTNIDYNNLANYQSKSMLFPLKHPNEIRIIKKLEDYNFANYFSKKTTVSENIRIKINSFFNSFLRSILFRFVPESRNLFNENIYWKLSTDFNIKDKSKVKLNKPFSISNSTIGDYTYVAMNSMILNTVIGKFCSIGPNLFCGWGIHPVNGISTNPMFYSTKLQNGISLTITNKIEEMKSIKIGNDVFIGANVTILDGIEIGDGAIIGAGAVVSKNIPPYSIAVGSPIQIIKKRFDEVTISKLLKVKWWDWEEEKLKKIEENFFDIKAFLDKCDNE